MSSRLDCGLIFANSCSTNSCVQLVLTTTQYRSWKCSFKKSTGSIVKEQIKTTLLGGHLDDPALSLLRIFFFSVCQVKTCRNLKLPNSDQIDCKTDKSNQKAGIYIQ